MNSNGKTENGKKRPNPLDDRPRGRVRCEEDPRARFVRARREENIQTQAGAGGVRGGHAVPPRHERKKKIHTFYF